MSLPDQSARFPTWVVVLAALLAPIAIMLVYETAMDWSNRPVSTQEWNSNPHAGQELSDRNSFIVFMHASAQFAFVILGAWWLATTSRQRTLFLIIAIPLSGFIFLLATIGSMAG